MLKYILKRLGLAFLTFFVLMTINFFLIRTLEPNLPIDREEAQAILRLREALGYNKPIIVQYGIFLKNLITKFELGYSFKIQNLATVNEIISTRLPPTVLINIYSTIFSVPIGIALGIYAALMKNKWQDHFVSTLVMVVVSVPGYVFAFALQYFLGYKIRLFPVLLSTLNAAGGSWVSPAMFKSMVLPILASSFGTIAGFTRIVRAELSEVLTSEFMLLARTKGLTKLQATVKHAFKNSMVPIMPMIIGSVITVLEGSFILESIFSIPGVGGLFLRSINELDYNVFLGVSMFYIGIGLLSGIVVDISAGFIDPRIRMGARR